MKRAVIQGELRVPVLVLAGVIAVLALAGVKLHTDIAHAGYYSRAVRVAQTSRARVLGYQLDEETGLRGFSATGDVLFLEPYRKAGGAMDNAFADLRRNLATLNLGYLQAVVDREQHENAQWLTTIAAPLTAMPARSPSTLELQRRGKQIVDNFRNDDQQLVRALDRVASDADAQIGRVISNTAFFVLATLAVLCVAGATFGVVQERTSRRAFRNRLLYENEKRVADSLQEAFLNTSLPDSPTIGLHATYIPAMLEAQVGGDWYDAFELPDKRILFSIGDVAGHGIEAAVIMNRARQSIVAAALHENDPAKVLERANDAIYLQKSRMVTAICGYIDPKTLEISYATAGHPPPILARPGESSLFLPHEGIPLGIEPGTTYRTFVAHAFDGAVMVLYTDGVVEHKRNIIEGEQQLLDATQRSVLEDDPALAIKRYMFPAGAPADDVAILTVTFKTTGENLAVTSIGALQFNRLEIELAGTLDEPRAAAPANDDEGREGGAHLQSTLRST